MGTCRWTIERIFAWLHDCKYLRIRWKHRADIHEFFIKFACCLITRRQIKTSR
ncbi:transposase [Streptomyces griseus]|uniref:transposase n=1 Tax=Streptomyces griseus TaxID=1911 RepID=UPI00366390F8